MKTEKVLALFIYLFICLYLVYFHILVHIFHYITKHLYNIQLSLTYFLILCHLSTLITHLVVWILQSLSISLRLCKRLETKIAFQFTESRKYNNWCEVKFLLFTSGNLCRPRQDLSHVHFFTIITGQVIIQGSTACILCEEKKNNWLCH